MSEEFNRTADWAPGTLDKTRKNIGEISEKDAADMAKKLGGKVMYERSENKTNSQNSNRTGRIVRNSDSMQGASGNMGNSSKNSQTGMAGTAVRRHTHEDLPVISKKVANATDNSVSGTKK